MDFKLLITIGVLGLAGSQAVEAGTSTFSATADAYARKASASKNFGTATELAVDGDQNDPTEEAFIKFSVNNIQGTVTSAKIRLYVVESSSDGPGLYLADSSWSESALTWNNRPKRSTKIEGKGAVSLGWLEYDVKSVVKTNGTYSFGLAEGGSDGTVFSSRNASSNRPQLVVVTADSSPSPSPSPSAAPIGSSMTSGTAFLNQSFSAQRATFQISFDAVPLASGMDGVTGISNEPANGYEDFAAAVRFNPSGKIDVRNGGDYDADSSIGYSANQSFHFRLVIDPVSHRYSVYVKPAGGLEVPLASSYSFRTGQSATSVLNNIGLRAGSGSHRVSNILMQSGSGPIAPSPTVTPTATPSPSPVSPPPAWTSMPCKTVLSYMGQDWGNDVPCESYALGMSSSKRVLRFELHPGDRRDNDTSSVDRNELASKRKFDPNTDLWNAFSFRIEPGSATVSGSNNIGQWHAGISKSPPFTINMASNNQVTFMTQNDSGKTIHKTVPIERGTWYNMVVHVRFSNGASTGVLEVWMNGVKQVSVSGARIGYTSTAQNYWKFGIYRTSQSAVQVNQYANMEAGDANLSDRIAKPLPIAY